VGIVARRLLLRKPPKSVVCSLLVWYATDVPISYIKTNSGVLAMSLTTHDLQQIKGIVTDAVKPLDDRLSNVEDKLSGVEDRLSGMATKADLDRMETRILAAMGLIERDAFSRLDEHEERITRLEKASAH
jgi:hypothetical protein